LFPFKKKKSQAIDSRNEFKASGLLLEQKFEVAAAKEFHVGISINEFNGK
jgi:hypothetical protein